MGIKGKKHIRVTQSDINCGEPGSFNSCPVACAIVRTLRTYYTVRVRDEGLFIGEPGESDFWVGDLPVSVRRFIKQFDNEKRVKPFEFDVTIR